MASLKASSKSVLSDAVELQEERGLAEVNQLQAYLLLATAALSQAEADDAADDETAKTIKRARKIISALIDSSTSSSTTTTVEESNDVAEKKGLDLGQYAHTKVFDGDSKKVEKFARLMGGKSVVSTEGHHTQHNTFAADSKTTKRITHEIEEQFNAAMQHKGKKGLGC
ncbi:Hypothetical protein, putative [Bodo saltans]|uniref:Small acidic protein n=1 Tax=Bodo saltans TaxID=75058 RepID=A0A0S4JK89_BODSA|nr:Hypothetical protein, putative [Bodo saltans]|eukprot:CUG89811.1 Hypothetical protein, putative [Bodo saltans]